MQSTKILTNAMALHGGKFASNFGPIREQLDFF